MSVPALSDKHAPSAALEGSEPRPDVWPAVTRPTPEAEWEASPGAGHVLREVADGTWPAER